MFEIYKFSEPQIITFILVLIRLSVFVATMPLIGSEQVPARLKMLFGFSLAILVFPTVAWNKTGITNYDGMIIWLAAKEALVGVILGFVARLFFFAISISGEVISFSVGLSSEQLLNPSVGGRVTAIQQFQVLLGTMLFFSLNGHFYMLAGIVQSFDAIPISMKGFEILTAKQVAALGQEVIWSGVKMGAPVMAAIFFSNVVMGVLGRAVPQINVLITSMPVNVMVGLIIFMASIPLMLTFMDGLAETTATRLFQIMKGM